MRYFLELKTRFYYCLVSCFVSCCILFNHKEAILFTCLVKLPNQTILPSYVYTNLTEFFFMYNLFLVRLGSLIFIVLLCQQLLQFLTPGLFYAEAILLQTLKKILIFEYVVVIALSIYGFSFYYTQISQYNQIQSVALDITATIHLTAYLNLLTTFSVTVLVFTMLLQLVFVQLMLGHISHKQKNQLYFFICAVLLFWDGDYEYTLNFFLIFYYYCICEVSFVCGIWLTTYRNKFSPLLPAGTRNTR